MEDTHKFGDKNLKTALIFTGIGALAFQIFFWTVIYPQDRITPEPSSIECKADSLQNIIDSLQGEQEVRNKIRDEEVETLKILVGKYEFGLTGLDKANRKEFIRHAMFREDYSERVNEDYFEENRKLKARYADYK
jgi:hypothetical protein